MRKISYIITVVFIFFIGIQAVVSQQNFNKDFSYGANLKGSLDLKYSINQNGGITTVSVEMNVEWEDERRNKINTPGKPYLILSKYFLSYKPANTFICLNFENGLNEVRFQTSQNLIFKSIEDFTGKVDFIYEFQYSNSFDINRDDEIDAIRFVGEEKKGQLITPLLIPVPKIVVEDLGDNENLAVTNEEEKDSVENQTDNLQNNRIIEDTIGLWKELHTEYSQYQESYKSLLSQGNFADPGKYLTQFQKNLENAKPVETNILQETYTGITDQQKHVLTHLSSLNFLQRKISDLEIRLTSYENRNILFSNISSPTENLKNEVNTLITNYRRFRTDINQMLGNSKLESFNPANVTEINKPDSRSIIEVFKADLISLESLDTLFRNIYNDLDTERSINDTVSQSNLIVFNSRFEKQDRAYVYLITKHDSIKNDVYSHQDLYGEIIPDLDELDSQFSRLMVIVGKQRDLLAVNFDQLKPKIPPIDDSTKSFTFLWLLLGAILIILFYIIISRIINRRKEEKSSRIGNESWENGLDPFTISEKPSTLNNDIGFYFPVKWEDNNKSYVKGVFFNRTLIKEIFNFSRNSMNHKMAFEVGGFLFGHYEKVGKNGIGAYNIFIDKFVPARNIESSSYYQMDFGADAVDELENAVHTNQNMALTGWFHTHPGHSPILSESNAEIHNRYFNEKWQISLIIDPADEACSAAVYANSPNEGILRQGADVGDFMWKDLASWAENPEAENIVPHSFKHNEKQHFLTHLNDKWCDSVVDELKIERNCILGIRNCLKKKDSGLLKNNIAGFLYGNVNGKESDRNNGECEEYDIVVEEFIESGPGNIPKKTSGFHLLGWFGFDDCEMFELIEPALKIHESEFKEKWQLVMLLNRTNHEFRIFSRRQNLKMNNNVIETNELDFREIIDWAQTADKTK